MVSTVTLRLKQPDGGPLTGVTVTARVSASNTTVETDADGVAAFRLDAGSKVRFACDVATDLNGLTVTVPKNATFDVGTFKADPVSEGVIDEVAVIAGGDGDFETLADGATVTWAFGGKESRNAKVTLAGNRTLAITGATNGATGTIFITQDGTGSRTLALPAGSKVIGGGDGEVTLTETAGATDALSFCYDGEFYFWVIGLNFTAAA